MNLFNKVLSVSVILFGTALIYKASNKSSTLERIPNKSKDSNDASNLNDAESKTSLSPEFEHRNQMMYKELEMTEYQRLRYEESLNTVINDWEHNNPNTEIDKEILSGAEDKSLKALLNEMQYGIYRDWTEKYVS